MDATVCQPHVAKNCSVIEYFFEEKYTRNLAINVIFHEYDQLKSMIYDLKDTLLKATRYDSDRGVLQDFGRKVNELFHFPDFVKTCADMYFDEFMDIGLNMTIDMNSYKIEYQPIERWEMLQPDISFLTSLLQADYDLLVTRGILSVIFGYWCNDALCKKVRGGIYASSVQDDDLPTSYRKLKIFPFQIVDGTSIGLTPSVKVLKKALFSTFPSDKAQMASDQGDDFLVMFKRKASPNALDADETPDAKRIQVTEELVSESSCCKDIPASSEAEEMEDIQAQYSFMFRFPHLKFNATVIEYLFEVPHTRVLAQKVHHCTQLKEMIYDLKDSLLIIFDGGDGLQDFARKVNELFNHKEFIQACVETCFDGNEWCCDIVGDLDVYQNKNDPIERLKMLDPDIPFLANVLKAKHCALVIRGVLSVLYGGWCDDALCKRVKRGICDAKRAKTCLHPTVFCPENFCDISVPASDEVLKEALCLILLSDKAEIIYGQVQRYKEDYNNKKGGPYVCYIMIWRSDHKFYAFDLRCLISDSCWVHMLSHF